MKSQADRTVLLMWLACVALALWEALALVELRGALDRQALGDARAVARLGAAQAEALLEATQSAMASAIRLVRSDLVEPGRLDPAAIGQQFKGLAQATPAADTLILANGEGMVLANSLSAPNGASMRGEAYLERMREEPHLAALMVTQRGRESGQWGLMMARAIRGDDGVLLGVLAAHVALERTFLPAYRNLELDEGRAIALWNEQRELLLRVPFSGPKLGTGIDLAPHELTGLLAGQADEAWRIMSSPVDGSERMVAIRRLARYPLALSVASDRIAYLAPWREALQRALVTMSALAVACALLTRALRHHRRTDRRLRELIDAAPLGVVCFDHDARGRPVPFAANRAARRLLDGREDGADLPDLGPLKLDEALARLSSAGEPLRLPDQPIAAAEGTRRLKLQLFPVATGQAGLLIEDATERLEAIARLEQELALWRSAAEESDQGLRDWLIGNGTMAFSRRWARQLGYAPGEIEPTLAAWESLVHPEDLGEARRDIERHVGGLTAAYRSELRMRCKDGSYRWMLERGRVVARSEDGRALRMVSTQTDISAMREMEANLALWASVFAGAHEGIVITDSGARIVEANDAYCSASGYSRSQLVGENPRIMNSGQQPPELYHAMWVRLQLEGSWQGELLNRRADGSVFAQRTRILAIHNRAGEVTHYVGFTLDVTELQDSRRLLDHLQRHDALTALPNRERLGELVRHAIAVSERSGALFAVCALDIDHFKPINERLGGAEANQLLVDVARRLQSCIEPGDSLARLGGDEFALLLTGIADSMHCAQRLQALRAALAPAFDRGGTVVRLTASIGATLYPLDGADADTLLRHADQALYAAKQAGRDLVQFFDAEQDRRLRTHRRALTEVRGALEDGQLRLHYQPKVRFEDGRMIGVEALLRWQHPQRGLLMPADFLAGIDDDGLLTAIGEWCLATAVSQAARWHHDGYAIPVSVNVTAGQILGPDFASRLEALLDRHPGFPPHLLEIELLESAALVDLPRVVALMERCNARGVSFALDDFGTGYASLTYLKHLPAGTLKIDQSFVRDILDDSEHRAIVEGVLSLTRVFGRTAIAEGVESIEQGVALIMLGATHAQGYVIAGALTPEQLLEWHAGWRNPPDWTRAGWRYRNKADHARAQND